RFGQATAVNVGQRRQHRRDLLMRSLVEPGEGLPSLGGEAELVLTAVARQGLSRDQPLLVEILDDAAEIAGVEPELDPDLLRGEVLAMRELVEHARLAQREH